MVTDECTQSLCRFFVCAQSGTHGQSVVVVGTYGFRHPDVGQIMAEYGFGHTALQDVVVHVRRMDGQFAHSASQASLCREDGCASHAVLSAYEQGMPHAAFVGERVTRFEYLFHLSRLYHRNTTVDSRQSLGGKPDVHGVYFTEIFLVLAEKEGQFRKLDGQGQVRTDDGRRIIVCVVFAHQAGRDVDAHHFGRTGVDSFHESGIAPVQRLIQSGTEQSVYDDVFFVHFRERKLGRYFGEQQSGQVFQPFLVVQAIVAETSRDVKQIRLHRVPGVAEQAGYRQGIASVVARTGKHDEASGGGPTAFQFGCNRFCGTFHQIGG